MNACRLLARHFGGDQRLPHDSYSQDCSGGQGTPDALAEPRNAALTRRPTSQDRFPIVKPKDFVFATTKPAIGHPFPDVSFLSVHFDFSTVIGPSYGIANLIREKGEWVAYTCFTFLEGCVFPL